jgi:hypothetical protein
MRRSNCLVVALVLWWRRGGYLIVRKSRTTWVPHFMWTRSIEGLEVIEYKPVRPLRGRLARWLPVHVVLFRGRLRRGVGEEEG